MTLLSWHNCPCQPGKTKQRLFGIRRLKVFILSICFRHCSIFFQIQSLRSGNGPGASGAMQYYSLLAFPSFSQCGPLFISWHFGLQKELVPLFRPCDMTFWNNYFQRVVKSLFWLHDLTKVRVITTGDS
jgi:hypothetical protein